MIPGLPFRQDSAPSVSLSWVPLKPELILNLGKDWFLLIWPEPNSTILNFLEMMRLVRVLVRENRSLRYALESLVRRSNAGRVVLRVPLVPRVPETR
ncbi:hypothetical protein F2Q68_00033883 [Brassica cretica]|uniref:Uncharacterized protein n=1 Tax=Brassica cretica TaxID=69181 RepID=A0A8S9GYU4_BRACR|nr:hypothetical protein F2Q68_00033883 [Brassica cretica]